MTSVNMSSLKNISVLPRHKRALRQSRVLSTRDRSNKTKCSRLNSKWQCWLPKTTSHFHFVTNIQPLWQRCSRTPQLPKSIRLGERRPPNFLKVSYHFFLTISIKRWCIPLLVADGLKAPAVLKQNISSSI